MPSYKVYLAAPYWHDIESVREDRFLEICRAAGRIMLDGHVVFSPISHSHPIAKWTANTGSHDFWLRQDFPFVDWCDQVWVLKLPGWTKSIGIKAEIRRARAQGKRIRFIDG